jgi:hypothetical protein
MGGEASVKHLPVVQVLVHAAAAPEARWEDMRKHVDLGD